MNNPSALGYPLNQVKDLLSKASVLLGASGGLEKQVARLEARALAAFAWEVVPSWLIAHDTDWMSAEQVSRFNLLLERRLEGEPIAYITGLREFYGREFHVTPDVLIPRPETELLVDLALARIPHGQPVEILDLGTGSGCIAITLALERPHAHITSVDNSHAALAIASLNAHKWSARVHLLESNWFSALGNGKFDLIVGNPPYIDEADTHLNSGDVRYEPASALRSGKYGMDALTQIIGVARAFMKADGWLILEHGYNQSESVQKILGKSGFTKVDTRQDLAGHDRVTLGRIRRDSLHTLPGCG